MKGNVKETHQSKTLEDRKTTSQNPFLACLSNKLKDVQSEGIKPRALCKTQNATMFAQNILMEDDGTELVSQSPMKQLRSGDNFNEQNRHFWMD
jgi:hypothetical protein